MPLVAVLIDYRFEVRYHFVDFAGVFWRDQHIDCLASVNRFEGCCHAGEAKGGKMLGIGLADFCLPIAHPFRVGFDPVAVADWRTAADALAAARGGGAHMALYRNVGYRCHVLERD